VETTFGYASSTRTRLTLPAFPSGRSPLPIWLDMKRLIPPRTRPLRKMEHPFAAFPPATNCFCKVLRTHLCAEVGNPAMGKPRRTFAGPPISGFARFPSRMLYELTRLCFAMAFFRRRQLRPPPRLSGNSLPPSFSTFRSTSEPAPSSSLNG